MVAFVAPVDVVVKRSSVVDCDIMERGCFFYRRGCGRVGKQGAWVQQFRSKGGVESVNGLGVINQGYFMVGEINHVNAEMVVGCLNVVERQLF